MGFWDIAGKIGKGAVSIAIDIAKELPAAAMNQAGRQADRQLNENKNLTSEQREKLENISDRAKR